VPGRLLIPLCLLALALAPPATAGAAKPPFVGVNLDGVAVDPQRVVGELRRVAKSGARSVRWTINWPALQPYGSWADVPEPERGRFRDVEGIPTDFGPADRFITAAVRARLRVLPVVMESAPWAAENPYVAFSPPRDPEQYGRYAGLLADRYGHGGRFWREHRRLPYRPVRAWQIWNEPAGVDGFGSPSWAWQSERDQLTTYVAMLTAASREIRKADPRARVMLSGLFGRTWTALDQLYAAGARKLFDEVALHPFTRKPVNMLEIVKRARAAMNRHGDRAKPISVTELAWPSSLGAVTTPFEFAVTEAQQPRLLERGFKTLARARKRLKIRTVYWYTWMTNDVSKESSFDYAGLLTRRYGWSEPKPAFWAFTRVARRLNGSSKLRR
jgi:hypothetical protein